MPPRSGTALGTTTHNFSGSGAGEGHEGPLQDVSRPRAEGGGHAGPEGLCQNENWVHAAREKTRGLGRAGV